MKKIINYHAKLVIHGLPEMESATLRRLVIWLEATAKELKFASKKAELDDYAKTYTKRLMK